MKLDVWQKNSRTLSFFQFSRPALSLIIAVLALVLLATPALALTWINNPLGYDGVYWEFYNGVSGVYADGSMVYVASNPYGLFISTDGGDTFIQKTAANGLPGDFAWDVYADGSTIYVAASGTGGGLSISTDGGNTFTRRTIADGLGSNWAYGVHADSGKIYLASGFFDNDQDMFCRDGGVSISTDGGSTFSNKRTGLGSNCVLDVYADGNMVYAGTYGGLSISTDGGNTFNNKTTTDGLVGNRVTGVYTDSGKIYAATQRYELVGSYGDCTGGGLSISADGGNTFSNKLVGKCLNAVYASGDTVYAATGSGLFISADGGNTFTNETTANGLGHNIVRDVYANNGKVYAATYKGLSIAAGITDLQSQPDSEVGKVKLSWTAPDVSAGSGSSTKYDIRYSSTPLDESSWISATQVQNEPTPANPGVTQTMTISVGDVGAAATMTGTQRYFGIKVVNTADNPLLPLSNVPSLLDIGFRPKPDGYNFKNWGFEYLTWFFPDFTFEDMRRMFGTKAVCLDDQCKSPLLDAKIWLNNVNKKIVPLGRCGGFASTSLRFFLGDDDPSVYQNGAKTAIELQKDNVRRHITYYQVLANIEPIRPTTTSTTLPISNILDELRSGISNRDPRVLYIGWVISDANKINMGAHYVTPYAIEEQGNGKWKVWVYDSNELNGTTPIPQVFTINKDAWEYSGLRGSASNNNQIGVAAIPISIYNTKNLVYPWSNGSGSNALTQDMALSTAEVWLTGYGHLLITDSHHRRMGIIGNQFVREIPDAYSYIIAAGLGDETEPIYKIPLSDTYTILLDGQTLTQTEKTSVTQFGPGYAISIDDIPLNSTSQDQIIFTPNGKQLSYRPNQTKAVTFTLALDQADRSSQFQVKNLTIGANQSVTITADLDHHQLILNNANNGSSQYDLVIKILTQAGEYIFYHPGITIAATDTHYASYNPANNSEPVTISIDHGSNGTIDEVISVVNQPQAEQRVYLPTLRK